jgi:transcriptional regulator with XRE-family HTH domain
MPKLTLQALGRKLLEKRGNRGIREIAQEIGISSATLSRVERGYLPDIETFGKICQWLQVDPGEILGMKAAVAVMPQASIHFRKKPVLKPETAQALGQMILAAQRALMASEEVQ